VAAVVPFEDGLIVVRHAKEGRQYHLLPGGGVAKGESLVESLRREVLEETGVECEPMDILCVNDSIAPDGSRHMVQVTFRARLIAGTPSHTGADDRVTAVDVVPPAKLTTLDLRPPLADILQTALGESGGTHPVYLGPLWLTPSGQDT
jgi:ADP-ribose pyrophosphatase YjhB (NUDIX family)